MTGAVARVLAGDATERAVTAALRSLPHLDDDGRGRVARRITGTCVRRLALAHDVDGPPTAAALVSAYVRIIEGGAPSTRALPDDPLERIVVEGSCPRPLAEALARSLGMDGARAFLAIANQPGPKTLRANTLRTTGADLARRLLLEDHVRTRPGKRSPWALHVEGRANLFGSAAWRDGFFEVQDEGSQCIALACAPVAGSVVVDLCAGRGGKTLALAAMMDDRGALHVHDVDARALADMQPRLTRAGVRSVVRGVPADGTADLVLVDAPCTSTGVLRRWPDLRYRFDPASVLGFVETQRALLEQAARLVKSGGRVVYATCSVLREENEDVVAHAPASLHLDASERWAASTDGGDSFTIATFTARA